jgi:hypothetical protein
VLSGRGKFQKRCVVDGGLEISTAGSTDDERLREWISESHAVLSLYLVVEDLRRRVEELEDALTQLRRNLADPSPRRSQSRPANFTLPSSFRNDRRRPSRPGSNCSESARLERTAAGGSIASARASSGAR